jgi:hypothetical protein
MVLSVCATLVFSALAIVCFSIMKIFMKDKPAPMAFDSLGHRSSDIMVEYPPELEEDVKPYIEILERMFKTETGRDPKT